MKTPIVALLLLLAVSQDAPDDERALVRVGVRVKVTSPALKAYPISSSDRRGPSRITGIVTAVDGTPSRSGQTDDTAPCCQSRLPRLNAST